MNLLISLITLTLVGCASIPPEVSQYVTEWREVYGNDGSRVTIAFDELPERTNGVCQYRAAMPNRIVLNIRVWHTLSEKCKRALVFHELAHCKRDLQHTESGLMRPILDCDADTNNLKFGME